MQTRYYRAPVTEVWARSGISQTELCGSGIGTIPHHSPEPEQCPHLPPQGIRKLNPPDFWIPTLLSSSSWGASGRMWDRWIVWLCGGGQGSQFTFACVTVAEPYLHTAKSWSVWAWYSLLASPWWLPETSPRNKDLQSPGDSLRPYLIELICCKMLFQWVSLIGSWQVEADCKVS